MRTKETRKWVDKMKKAAKSNQGSPKKRKLSAEGSLLDPVPNKSLPNLAPEKLLPPSQLVKLSVVHGTGDICRPRDASPVFPYKPLDSNKLEIRVVTLEPGEKSSPIECSLKHVATNRGSRPSYKALSYTWGLPEIQKTILLDGIWVQVRENLWQALYHLRNEESPLRLWIDAICINQNDIPERNETVSRMGTLYSMADEVLVWLGPEEDGSRQALEYIVQNMSSRGETLSFDVTYLLQEPEFKAIIPLTRRDYWNRAWIIQEVFRARKVFIHCGYERLPWTQLAKFFRAVEKYEGSGDVRYLGTLKDLQQSLPAKFTKHRTAQDSDLETLLLTYKGSLCADPRDKIYSILGLAGRRISASARKKPKSQWIPVDYSKSAQELFEILALLYYDEGGRPGHFAHSSAFIEPTTYSSEPSSGMDSGLYQVQRMQMLQQILGLGPLPLGEWVKTPVNERASRELRCTMRYNLIVSGVGPHWRRGVSHSEIMSWYKHVLGKAMPSMLAFNSALESLSSFDYTRLQSFLRTKHHFNGNKTYDTARDTLDIRPFTTYNGRVGLTSCEISSGDSIACFPGSDIAVAVDLSSHLVKGRAFILKSESRGPGIPSASEVIDAVSFRYAVPGLMDGVEYSAMCIKGGIYLPGDITATDIEARGRDLALSLVEWQSLTW